MNIRNVVDGDGRGRAPLFAILAALGGLSPLLPGGECAAASKEECMDAHSHGQDMREKGQLTRARQTFLACAQSSCPGLIQADCARFGEDIERLLPSVSFGVRDAKGTDLPDTAVYVDDALVAMRLDDGKSYELDPGKHAIRFVHDGKETTLNVILNQGEKGRALVANLPESSAPEHAPTSWYAPPPPPKRSALPLVVAGIGAGALAAGGVLLGVGLSKVPDSCSVSSKECAAPPGDPRFDDARSGVSLANLGLGVGIGGSALLVGGLVWYVVQPARAAAKKEREQLVQPWIGGGSGGLRVSSSF